jgi:hypothetical protein
MKVLLFDIESAPILGYTWGIWEQNVLNKLRDSYMLCYAYRWLDEKKTHVVALPDFDTYARTRYDDKELIHSLHALFEEADVIIAHNGDQFDIKYSNSRFLVHGLPPPSSYRTVDTLKIARSQFKLDSNKLDALGKTLGIGRKVETGGFKLWEGCMDGDERSWFLMKKYNKQDVDLLLAVYEKLRGWKKAHPSLTADVELTRPVCSTCQSLHVQKKGIEFKGNSKQQRWKCQDCGANLYTSLKGNKPLRS